MFQPVKDRLSDNNITSESVEIPSDEKVIMTRPAIFNYETDVRMAFHVIQEATARFSLIQIISGNIANIF